MHTRGARGHAQTPARAQWPVHSQGPTRLLNPAEGPAAGPQALGRGRPEASSPPPRNQLLDACAGAARPPAGPWGSGCQRPGAR
ncbi:hypothetical protein GW7_05330 [Heterocephalus glaber]|uniref:Uncharacterized protein n=1 Tax=Heterocephalus glaber TaxID=10181 RepID=G5APY7_HETGA|nr:hypothetical protein GW7_05330 [Heterocephalus glaber]